MQLSRRGLLVGAAGGGLLVAYALMPRRYPLPLSPAPGETAFNAWIKVARDGVVSVAVPQCEMGQGITTLIPQIVAMELGADWRQIAVEPAAISAQYANPVLAARWAGMWAGLGEGLAGSPEDLLARRFSESHRLMITADGTALAAYEKPVREAAAGVRNLLAQAAADRWGVAWEECEAEAGFILHDRNRARFGELAAEAATYSVPSPAVMRPEAPRERPRDALAGLPPRYPRLDAPSKVDGSFAFAGDIRLPNMVYAAIAHGPIGETVLSRFEPSGAKGIVGLVGVVRTPHWLAAVGTSWWAADRALAAMRPRFDARSLADSGTIDNAMDAALRSGRAHRLAEIGDPDALIGTKPSLASRYEVAPALHVTVETSTATARLIDGTLELWVATQAPEQARRAAARALKLAEADVVVYPLPAGGSFDRRLEQDVAVEAATIAREVGRPVQLVYSRHQETLRGWPRTPVIALLAAKTVSSGGIAAWRARLALPGTSHEFASRLFDLADPFAAAVDNGERKDPLALEGAAPPYTIPNLAVDHVPVEIGLPTGRYRGNANGYTAFFTESFVDELAHLARREPLSFRIEMLAGDERLVGCLIAASRLGQWGGGGDASGQGVACHRIDDIAAPRKGGGRIAVIATARRDASGVRVDSLAAVADIGRIINLDIARQQIEGGLVYGLGMAMGGAAAYDRGIPESSRLASLDLPLMADCPRISVEFVDSDAPPFDPGELGAVAVAPAVANALFSATGLRFRRLPLLSEGL